MDLPIPPNAHYQANQAALAKIRRMDLRLAEAPFAYLTPDMIIAFCQSKLRDMDGQVQGMMAEQQKSTRDTQALSELAEVLRDNQCDIGKNDDEDGKGQTYAKQKEEIDNAYTAAIAKVGADSPLGKQLATEQLKFEQSSGLAPSADPDDGLPADEMSHYLKAVETIQSDMNLGGELRMMKLQSLMSKRQSTLQMCTNMVATMSESLKAIAAKIGQ